MAAGRRRSLHLGPVQPTNHEARATEHMGIRTGMLPHTIYSPNQFRTFKTVRRSHPERRTGGKDLGPLVCTRLLSLFIKTTSRCGGRTGPLKEVGPGRHLHHLSPCLVSGGVCPVKLNGSDIQYMQTRGVRPRTKRLLFCIQYTSIMKHTGTHKGCIGS